MAELNTNSVIKYLTDARSKYIILLSNGTPLVLANGNPVVYDSVEDTKIDMEDGDTVINEYEYINNAVLNRGPKNINTKEGDVTRNGYLFRYYFNAGLDRTTGNCDEEGSDVFIIDNAGTLHWEAEIVGVLPQDIADMTEAEFENFINEYGIF